MGWVNAFLAEMVGQFLAVIDAGPYIIMGLMIVTVLAGWLGGRWFRRKPKAEGEPPAQSADTGLEEAAPSEPIPENVLCAFTQEELYTSLRKIPEKEAAILISQCLGKLIWVDGTVSKIDTSLPHRIFITLSTAQNSSCLLIFDVVQWRERFSILALGDQIIAMGKIQDLDRRPLLTLENCTMSRHLQIPSE